jgi:hypothetical protein
MRLFAYVLLTATVVVVPAWAHRCEISCRQIEAEGKASSKLFCAEEYTPRACADRATQISEQMHLTCRARWADHCQLSAEKLDDSTRH